MKIEISYGCTSFYTSIDEKSLGEVDLDAVLDYILPKVRSGIKDGTIQFDSLIRIFQCSDSKTGESCEQCGDCVTVDTYEI